MSKVHNWFGLTRARYLVLPRSLMEGMPDEWQEKMTALLDEMRETYDPCQINDNYTVYLRASGGRFLADPLSNYRHPPKLPYREAAT